MPASSGAPPSPAGEAAEAAALAVGARVGEYEVERTLGGGGFGITYLARDGNLNLPVALKEYFPADLAIRGPGNAVSPRGEQQDAQAQYQWGLERFLDEARALATFRHPNIVRVLRYFRENGTAYIVMEYESGLALKRWVPQHAPLSQRAVLSIVYPVLDGLEQVHKAGFLHRDIKPDNIYVRADGTPVLLDFGSARRVTTQRDLTNIVSPGFAPFEQYHSQGHQGPWTDVYSLGAVMYWMVTGTRPQEAAARIRTDGMPSAASLGDVAVYGASLLHAIDWALQPDEARRPQSVAEFRAAIEGSEQPPTHTDATVPAARMEGAEAAPTGAALSQAGTPLSATTHKRNVLGTILFLDLVGYSVHSVESQAQLKELFNELIAKALREVAQDSRIAIDTGDGAAICFTGDPEEALDAALLLRNLLAHRWGSRLSARIGLHLGPVRVISDINNRVNVIGDGINVAQRVMDFAQPNQVLVSRAYYDVIARIADETADMFRYLGVRVDKHGREHEVYSVEADRLDATRREPPPGPDHTRTVAAPGQALDDEVVHEIEVELARHIGPLARVLVRKTRERCRTPRELREALAASIQESVAREHFLASPKTGAPASSHSAPLSTPLSWIRSGAGRIQPRGSSVPLAPSAPRTAAAVRPSGPLASAAPAPAPSGRSGAVSAPSRPGLSQPASAGGPVRPSLSAEELAIVERALSKYIGPVARIVVKKEAGRSTTVADLIAGLAAAIDDGAQRQSFADAMRRTFDGRF